MVAAERENAARNGQRKWGVAVIIFNVVYGLVAIGMFLYVLTAILPQMGQ